MCSKKKSLSFFRYLTLKTLWHDSFPQSCQIFAFLVSSSQLLAILINSRFSLLKTTGHDSFSKGIYDIAQVITLDKVLPSSEADRDDKLWLFAMLLAWVYLSIFVFGTLFLLYKYHSHQRSMGSSNPLITFFGQFHLSVGFFWISHVLFKLNQDGLLENKEEILGGATWTKDLNWVFLVASYLFGAFFAIYSFDPFMSMSLFASHNSVFQTSTFVLKAFSVPFLCQSNDSKAALWIFAVFMLILAGARLYNLFEYFPYYQEIAMKCALFDGFICTFVAFSNFLAIAFSNDDRVQAKVFCYLDCFMIPLSVKVGSICFEKTKMRYLRIPDEKLKSEEAVLKKLFFVRCLINGFQLTVHENQKHDLNEVYFWSIFVKYEEMNKLLNLRLNSGESVIDDEKNISTVAHDQINNFRKMQRNFKEIIFRDLLQGSIQRIKQSNKIKTLLISSLMDRPEYLSSLIYFLSTLSVSKGYSQILVANLQVKIQNMIEKFFQNRENKVLDIKTYLDMENMSSSFLLKIHEAGKNFRDFWDYYNHPGLKITVLYEKSSEIEKLDEGIQHQWKKFIEGNPTFARRLSGPHVLYLSLVRNCPYTSQRIFDQYCGFQFDEEEEEFSNSNMYDEKNIVTQTSMSREKLGRIVNVSPNIVEGLGFQPQSLIGRNLNALVPSFMHEGHNKVVLEHLNKLTDIQHISKMYTNINAFVLNKTGSILPSVLYISIHPYVQKELVYVLMIKIKETQKDTLLVGADGYIQGFTRNAGLQLGLEGARKTHIQEVCRSYSVVDMNDGEQQGKTISNRKSDIGDFLRKILKMEQSEIRDLLQNLNLTLSLASSANLPGEHPKDFPTHLRLEDFCGNKIFILEFEKLLLENSRVSFDFQTPRYKTEQDPEHFGIPEERTVEELPFSSPRQLLLTKESHGLLPSRGVENLLSTQVNLTTLRMSHNEDGMSPRLLRPRLPSYANTELKVKVQRDNPKHYEADEVASVTSSKNSFASLERSIQGASQDERLNQLKIVMALLLILSSIALVIIEVDNNSILEIVSQDVLILNQAMERTSMIAYIGRLALVELMSVAGLFLDTRYELVGTVYPMRYIAMIDMGDYAESLNECNNEIRNSLYQIDPNLQERFYEKDIPVYMSDDGVNIYLEKYVNLFDLTDDIIATARKAYSTNPATFTLENTDLIFLVNNTFHGGIVLGEEIVKILHEDSSAKLENRETALVVDLILFGLDGVAILILIAKIQLQFFKKRDQLIEIFMTLEKGGGSTLKQFELLSKFLEDLEQSSMDSNYFSIKASKNDLLMKNQTVKSYIGSTNADPNNAKISRRIADMAGINHRILAIWGLAFLFAFSLLIIYIVLLPVVSAQNERIGYKADIMADSNTILYQFTLLRSMLYYYIFSDGVAKMREESISEQWDPIVDTLIQSPSFFINKVLDKEHGMGDNAMLESLIRGNICDLMKIGASIDSLCSSIAGGVLQNGLLAYNSFALAALRESKSVFDSSSRTLADMETALDVENLILMELLEFSFASNIYAIVNDLTKKQLIDDIDSYKGGFLKVIVVYIILSLVFGNLVWLMIVAALEREISNANKLLRRIPVSLIVNNKLLQNYLVKNNQNQLSSSASVAKR